MASGDFIAAVHTPFNKKGRLASAVVADQLELLVESGVGGVFVGGTSGEGPSLTLNERRALTNAWVARADGRLDVIVNVGHNCVRDAVTLAEHAAGSGATAIAAASPSYYRPDSIEHLIEYLAPIAAAATEIPFYYYDAPEFTGVRFPTDQILQWGNMRIPNLRGAKFTNRDLSTYQACMALEGGRFRMFLGYEDMYLAGLACGASAAIGCGFGFAGPVFTRVREAFDSGDLERARSEHAKATALLRVLRRFGFVRASKALMVLLGVDCGTVRLPLRPLGHREFRDLYEAVRAMDVFARPLGTPEELGR